MIFIIKGALIWSRNDATQRPGEYDQPDINDVKGTLWHCGSKGPVAERMKTGQVYQENN